MHFVLRDQTTAWSATMMACLAPPEAITFSGWFDAFTVVLFGIVA